MTADPKKQVAADTQRTKKTVKTKGELKEFPAQESPKPKAVKGKKFTGTKTKNGKPARNQFTMAEERRLERIREQNERKAEKEAKKMIVQKEKRRKLKILAKKNSKGQPLMKGRMQLLLEKIEKRVGG